MIESLMLIALGFLIATLFAIIAMQLVWRRAVTLTLRRVENGEGLAEENPGADPDASLHREIERLRDERDRLASANDEFGHENTRLSADADALRGEVGTLRSQIDRAAAQSADRGARLAAIRKELGNIETEMSEDAAHHEAAQPLPPAQSTAASPETHDPARPPEPAPAHDPHDDAHILAGMKAALAEQTAEPHPQRDETGETESKGDNNTRARPQAHISDAALAARIRALEAGVSPQA
ncbi:MAG: hypothetical protein K9G30_03825 [Parvibaculum sp.]|nr:hypothetical protein [Parvibaculum sp.]